MLTWDLNPKHPAPEAGALPLGESGACGLASAIDLAPPSGVEPDTASFGGSSLESARTEVIVGKLGIEPSRDQTMRVTAASGAIPDCLPLVSSPGIEPGLPIS